MEIQRAEHHPSVTIRLSGTFTFADNAKFKTILDMMGQGGFTHITLDLEALTFVDSAALGMLMIARDRAAQMHVTLQVSKPKGQVLKVFQISKFDELFAIQQ